MIALWVPHSTASSVATLVEWLYRRESYIGSVESVVSGNRVASFPGPGEGDLGMMLEHPFNSGVSHHKSAYNVIVNTFVYIPLCSNRVAIVQT